MQEGKKITKRARDNFQRTVYEHYRAHGRHTLPWRATHDPYRIIVSELMLQQTQVARVIEKYRSFLKLFPNVHALAGAPFSKVLGAWSGLGYNRRAKFLHLLAKEVSEKRKGKFPRSLEELVALPGIGAYTAGAVAAFAYNQPVALIETNIRSVFIHHFFAAEKKIKDSELLPLVHSTLDVAQPRQWYAALMDYGAFLKRQGNTVHRASAHYKKQSPFVGSKRQLRGAVVRQLIAGDATASGIATTIGTDHEALSAILAELVREKMIVKKGRKYSLAAA